MPIAIVTAKEIWNGFISLSKLLPQYIIGSHLIQEQFEQMNERNHAEIEEQMRTDLFDLLRTTISPEFLNRIDEVIMFTPLTRKDIRNIVKLQLNMIMQGIPNKQFTIEMSEEAIDWLAAVGYDPTHGSDRLNECSRSTWSMICRKKYFQEEWKAKRK